MPMFQPRAFAVQYLLHDLSNKIRELVRFSEQDGPQTVELWRIVLQNRSRVVHSFHRLFGILAHPELKSQQSVR